MQMCGASSGQGFDSSSLTIPFDQLERARRARRIFLGVLVLKGISFGFSFTEGHLGGSVTDPPELSGETEIL